MTEAQKPDPKPEPELVCPFLREAAMRLSTYYVDPKAYRCLKDRCACWHSEYVCGADKTYVQGWCGRKA